MKKQKTKKNKAKKAVRREKIIDIYLDYASATPVSKSVNEAMTAVSGIFANPGAIHAKGVEAKKLVADARVRIAKAIDAREEEIIFTASATESNSLALSGVVDAWQNMYPGETPHVIISAIEHPSVIEATLLLEEEGVELSRVPVDEFGVVDLVELKNLLKPNTVVVSIMMANNEIGTIEPLDAISKMLRRYKKEMQFSRYPLLHTDASQAFQYLPVRVVKPEVDLMTISSSKIYGPRGVALLYVKNTTPIFSQMPGGGQEHGRRGGTEATSLIVGFARAMEDVVGMRHKESERLRKIFEYGKSELQKKIPDAVLLGHSTKRLPNNFTFAVPGVESEYLVLALSAKHIFASSRSACQSDNQNDETLDSHVIMAIGGNPSDGTIRFSFGRDTREKDIQNALKVVAEAVEKWRSWSHAHKV
ncbi:MAG: hypothetical protein RL641_740 [Candidatus Parcubacteria bacterium]|jgi:cysteine desulfurase